jgi:SAM-dependent methyltransferase
MTSPRVQVRQGREGLELRVDGTLASLHLPGEGVTGLVWWSLAAPIILLPRLPRRRVLLLGLGGGSVARAIRALDPWAEIVGVERNPDVLRLARDHFGLDRLGLELVRRDALECLAQERRRFDLIVEDLFVGPSRSVRKPDWLLDRGYPLIGRRRRTRGIVVSNTIHEMPGVVRAMGLLGGRVVSLDARGHWNRIVVGGTAVPEPLRLRRILRAHPLLSPLLPRLAVRTRS